MAKGELRPVWTPAQQEVIDQLMADMRERHARIAVEEAERHKADSVLLNELVWMLRVQLGDVVAPGGVINRETLVQDVKRSLARLYDDGYRQGHERGVRGVG